MTWTANFSILHETVFTVAQAEQVAAAEEEEDLMIPDEFPQDAAHAHLLLGGQLLACDDGVGRNLHLVFLEAQLDDLVAQADKSDARRLVATVHHHKDSFSHFIVVVEEMNWIGVVFHGAYVLVDDANIGFFFKHATFFTPYINISRRFRTFADENRLSAVSRQLSASQD